MFLVVKREKSVDYGVRTTIFEKLLHFGSENRKNAGYLYEGIKNSIGRPKQASQSH